MTSFGTALPVGLSDNLVVGTRAQAAALKKAEPDPETDGSTGETPGRRRTMIGFVAALAGFVLLHVLVSGTRLRAPLVAALGIMPFRGLFSVASVVLIIAIVLTWGDASRHPANRVLWDLGAPGRLAALVLVNLGFLFAVGGVLGVNPTAAGLEGALKRPFEGVGFIRITRHPFLWGVVFWALGHLAANGNVAALALFGGLAGMCLLGTRSIDRKTAARVPESWADFRAATSNLPFAAIIAGRNRFVARELWWRVLIGLCVYGAAGWFHEPRIFPG